MDATRTGRRATYPNVARNARIIWMALLAGLVGFLAVALVLRIAPEPPGESDLLFWISVGFAAVLIPLSFLVRSMIHARGRGADDRVVPRAWFMGHLVQWALCEGAGYFGGVVTMLSAAKFPAVIVPAVSIAGLLVGYPSEDDLAQTP